MKTNRYIPKSFLTRGNKKKEGGKDIMAPDSVFKRGLTLKDVEWGITSPGKGFPPLLNQ